MEDGQLMSIELFHPVAADFERLPHTSIGSGVMGASPSAISFWFLR